MRQQQGASKLILLCWSAYMFNYVARYSYSASMSSMVGDGIFDIAFAGVIGTAFLAMYGTGQLINGLMGDKKNPKYMIFIGLLGSGLANILVAFSKHQVVILLLWGLNGYLCSMVWAPIVRIFSEYLLKERQLKVGSFISTSIPAGSILSYLLSSLLLRAGKWQHVFVVCGCIAVAMSLVWLYGMHSLRQYMIDIKPLKQQEAAENKVTVHVPFYSSRLLPLMISTGVIFTVLGIFFHGVLKEGVALWVPTYINQFFNTEASTASAVAIALPVFNLLGVYIAGKLFRNVFKNEMMTSAVLFAASTVALGVLFFFGRYSMILAVLMLAVTTACMLGVNNMFLTFIPLNFTSVGRAASVTGFLNACAYAASAISGVSIGLIASKYGWNMTVLSWIIVSLFGTVFVFAGVKPWEKGRFHLNSKGV